MATGEKNVGVVNNNGTVTLCAVLRVARRYRTDLLAPCLDQVEVKFDLYLQHENGNALVYDEVCRTKQPAGM